MYREGNFSAVVATFTGQNPNAPASSLLMGTARHRSEQHTTRMQEWAYSPP